ERRAAVFRDLADLINELGGRFLTGPDVGTTPADMAFLHTLTPYAAGFRAGAGHRLGTEDLAGVRVTIVGLGGVGERLARLLAQDGARLALADIDPARRSVAEELGAEWIPVDGAQRRATDIVEHLQCKLVVGAANNQLADDSVAATLQQRGIAWVPDFVANAGGLLYA